MAKFECVFPSGYSFNDILQYFHTHLTKNHGECTGSSDYSSERARVAVRVYERYSLMGDNYLSLTLTLVNDGGDTFASAISAAGRGGGLGISIHWGEDKFLEIFSDGANMFQGMRVLEKGCRDAAAKYEKHFRGDFRQVLTLIDRAVMDGGSSAALETAVA